MFVAFYFLTVSIFALQKLIRERDDVSIDDSDTEPFFGIRMFICDPYYVFLKYLINKNERQLIMCNVWGGFFLILVTEVIIFIVIHTAIQNTNFSKKDYPVFWFAAYIFAEACIMTFVIVALTLSKCCNIYINVIRKKEELATKGYSEVDIDIELQNVDISKRETEPNNGTLVNEKMTKIRNDMRKKKEDSKSYQSIFK